MDETISILKEVDSLIRQSRDYVTAIEKLQEPLKEAESNPLLSFDLPLLLKRIGVYTNALGDKEKAYEYLNKALKIAKQDLNKGERSDIRAYLALLKLEDGELDEALDYAQKALSHREIQDEYDTAYRRAFARKVYADILYEKGDLDEAYKSYSIAQTLSEDDDDDLYVSIVERMVDIDVKNDQYDKAMLFVKNRLGKEGITPFRETLLYKLHSKLEADRGNKKGAEESLSKALEIAKKEDFARHIGEIYEALGELTKAKEVYEEGNCEYNLELLKKKL